jgi:hypothetical protein
MVTRIESRKKSFWHAWDLNAWCSCDRSFLYLIDSNPSSHSSQGEEWRVRCVQLGQIYNAWTIIGTLGQGKIKIWSIDGKVCVSYFPTTCITITCTSPSSVGLKAQSTHSWANHLSSSPRGALSSSLHLLWPRGRERFKMEIKHLTRMLVFGEGLQDWVL